MNYNKCVLLVVFSFLFACEMDEPVVQGSGNAEVKIYGGTGEDFTGPAIFFVNSNDEISISMGEGNQLSLTYLLEQGESTIPTGETDIVRDAERGEALMQYYEGGIYQSWAGFMTVSESNGNQITGEIEAGLIDFNTNDTISISATFSAVKSSLN